MDYSDIYPFSIPKNPILSCCTSGSTNNDELTVDQSADSNEESIPMCCNPISEDMNTCQLCDRDNEETTHVYDEYDETGTDSVEFFMSSLKDFKFDKLSKPTGIRVGDDGITPTNDVLEKISMLTFNTGLLELKILGMQIYQNPPFTQRRLMQMPCQLINSNSDVIALQEVFSKSHARFLIKHMKPHYPYIVRSNFVNREFVSKYNVPLNRNVNKRSKFRNRPLFHHGLMFFSRFPIVFATFHSWREVTHLEGIFGNKGFMEIVCDVPSVGLVAFFNIHMASAALNPASKQVEDLRQSEIKQLFEAIDITIENKIIPIIIGDLNASPDNCANNYHYFIDHGWIDSWNVSKRRRGRGNKKKQESSFKSCFLKTIQSLKLKFSDAFRIRKPHTTIASNLKNNDKKLSLRIKDFKDIINKSDPAQKQDKRSIVDRLNSIGLKPSGRDSRHPPVRAIGPDSSRETESEVHPEERCEAKSGNSPLWEPRFPPPSYIGGGLFGLSTGSSDKDEGKDTDFPEEQPPPNTKKEGRGNLGSHLETFFADGIDDIVFKRSGSWHLFNSYSTLEDDSTSLKPLYYQSLESPELYNLHKTTTSAFYNERHPDSGHSNDSASSYFASCNNSAKSNRACNFSAQRGGYLINHSVKYKGFHSSRNYRGRLLGCTQFGRRRIKTIKKNQFGDEYTWDPTNPLNKIGPHSSCRGLRCDYIFLPPSGAARNLVQFVPKWSEILFREPCVLVDTDLQNCHFAYSICLSIKKCMLVTISDHYAVKTVLYHKDLIKQ